MSPRRALLHISFLIGVVGIIGFIIGFAYLFIVEFTRGNSGSGLLGGVPRPVRLLVFLWALIVPVRGTANLILAYIDVVLRPPLVPYPEGRWPKIALVVPVYKERVGIERTLQSLEQLTYPGPYKVIVVIDGEDDELDGTPELIRMFLEEHVDDGTFIVLQKPNGGKASALNLALAEARRQGSDLVMSVDGDAILEPDVLQLLAMHFQDPRIVASTGQVQIQNWLGVTGAGEGGAFPFMEALQALEYCAANATLKRGQSFFRIVTVIPGPCGMFRLDVLDRIAAATPSSPQCGSRSHPEHGPYPYGTLAEDLDVTFSLLRSCWLNGWLGGIVYEPTAVVWTDGRHHLRDFFRQRYRWLRGQVTSSATHFRSWAQGLDGKTRRQLFEGDALVAWVVAAAILGLIGVLGSRGALGQASVFFGIATVLAGLGIFHWLRTDREPGAFLLVCYFIFEMAVWPQLVAVANVTFIWLAVFDWGSNASFLLVWYFGFLLFEVNSCVFALASEKQSFLLLPYAFLLKPLYVFMLDTFKLVALLDVLFRVPPVWHQRYAGVRESVNASAAR